MDSVLVFIFSKMLSLAYRKEDKIIKLSVLIKNSKYVIINIGKVDILSYVSGNLSFDEEIITRKMEITLDYIDKIVKKIKKIKIVIEHIDKNGGLLKLSQEFY